MSGVRNMAAGLSSLSKLRSAIADLPTTLRADVARAAVDVLNEAVLDSFDGGRTVYDTPRPLSVDADSVGKALTLTQSGRTRGELRFVAVGTIVRAQLGSRYAKYLVGKYKILPQMLPVQWAEKLTKIVADQVDAFEARAAS